MAYVRRTAALRIAALAALLASAVLTSDHLHPDREFCPLAEACAAARESPLGTLAGVPTSVVGMVAFGGLILAGVIPWDAFSGIWLIFIGFFLASAARSAEAEADFSDRIDHLRVSDVMDAEPVAIPERRASRRT